MEVLVRLLLLLLLLSDKSITLESWAYVYVTFVSVSDLRNKILQLKHTALNHPVYKVISYFTECQKSKLFQIRCASQTIIGLVNLKRKEIYAVLPIKT